ncbi:hypothetical protein [Bradyrhizobium icense]|uniref:hypothetical protein n=1 Tax=Bradyrhizobium icense TaxID=1274631 RepID=UPI0009F429C4|nr:hypothetical protein [Bradyrhizobium icense]
MADPRIGAELGEDCHIDCSDVHASEFLHHLEPASQACTALPIITGRPGKDCANEDGCSKEITAHENRAGPKPGTVRKYAAPGHRVVVETNAGAGIGVTDEWYGEAGATIVDSAREVVASSEKVVRPS